MAFCPPFVKEDSVGFLDLDMSFEKSTFGEVPGNYPCLVQVQTVRIIVLSEKIVTNKSKMNVGCNKTIEENGQNISLCFSNN